MTGIWLYRAGNEADRWIQEVPHHWRFYSAAVFHAATQVACGLETP